MDLFDSWIYVYILNTKWFVWTIVGFVFAANVFSPVVIWLVFSGKMPRWRNSNHSH